MAFDRDVRHERERERDPLGDDVQLRVHGQPPAGRRAGGDRIVRPRHAVHALLHGVGPVRDRERVYLAAVHRIPALSEAGAMDYLRRFSEELDKLIDAAPERKRRAKAEATETHGTA